MKKGKKVCLHSHPTIHSFLIIPHEFLFIFKSSFKKKKKEKTKNSFLSDRVLDSGSEDCTGVSFSFVISGFGSLEVWKMTVLVETSSITAFYGTTS